MFSTELYCYFLSIYPGLLSEPAGGPEEIKMKERVSVGMDGVGGGESG